MPKAEAPIVVGVDGSPPSYAALDWAVAAAERRGRPLRIVHAVDGSGPRGLGESRLDTRAAEVAAEQIEKAEAYARTAAPQLTVDAEIVDGGPAAVLVAESRRAEIVVVGHRGLGGLTSLLAGSVGIQVTAHAHCPVVVVRPHSGEPTSSVRGHAAGRILVGVDGSDLSQAAIGFAFEEAALRGIGLTAVHAWRYPSPLGPSDALLMVDDWADIQHGESVLLAEALAGWQQRYPQVPVRHVVLQDTPGTALIDESFGAELLVIGARGRGGFAGLLLGSVSQAAIHQAGCPVAVLRHDETP